jgi:DNA-binding transcriptional LysR family regulator
MNFKDLENFNQVASYKSFSFAAKMMGISQPTLSESIKRLERDLGKTLFYRSKSGIELTPQGIEALHETAKLLEIKRKITSKKLIDYSPPRAIKIGCHPTVGRYFLPALLSALQDEFSNVTVDLIHAHSRDIQKLIQQGKVDIAIVVNPISNPDLIIKRVCFDKVFIWESSTVTTKKDQFIADLGLIQVQSILRKWKNPPKHHISTQDFQLIGEMVESGIGYGLLPERFVQKQKLKLSKVQKTIFFKDELSLIYRPEFNKDDISNFVVNKIHDIFKK